MKKLSYLLIVVGLCIVGYAGWQIVDTKMQTSTSLVEAKEIVESPPNKEIYKEEDGTYKPPIGEAVGILQIPKLNADLPIVEGTDPDDLEKGVGHYKGSYYPTENGQIVLSGHRDTVFRRAGELEIGDSLEIALPYGNFEYEITETKIVEPDDLSIITLQNEKEELILTTCYPFSYVGNAPQRYIIYAKVKNV
ncbi:MULTISPECIES: class D sortase [Metabacillus]|jgi:sortase A|uniref:Class D sortase n=1 Tax=Metabacillus rhizolycopersici TaxID=2875709 RepID=A0ABS7UKY4_9BACI|nr:MULTISPECIES: class D sortase [Metabacillus]MBZ5748981.1 class D sortase [Metabacillus rhizolycopersici]MCM3650930.1 class D sortase [Metabacillus litoralis]